MSLPLPTQNQTYDTVVLGEPGACLQPLKRSSRVMVKFRLTRDVVRLERVAGASACETRAFHRAAPSPDALEAARGGQPQGPERSAARERHASSLAVARK